MFQLSEARKNLSELVNEAYYEGKLFGISKSKKPMAVFVGFKAWQKIIGVIEKHDVSLAHTLAISIDPKVKIFENIKKLRTKQPGLVDYKSLINKGRDR